MSPAGIGIDLIDLEHFRVHYGDYDPELLARCFTDAEVASTTGDVNRLARLAARFAVKEAVYKALGGAESVPHRDIETVHGPSGAPEVRLHGAAEALALSRGVDRVLISLTHSGATAGAVAVAFSTGPK